jgi:methionyl-tRNA formyltransferase
MRIVFLGTPEFALPILEACVRVGDLVGVVAQPDRPAGRSSKPRAPPSKQWALEHGVSVEQPEKVKQGRLAQVLSRYKPDVAVVAAYGRILPADALAVPLHGCLNVHASLLPELRGAAPAQWAVARGYARTGVTIMQMDEGLDTGDIRLQRGCKVAADETGESLLRKLSPFGARVLGVALRRLERGELLRFPQDHSRATFAPMLTREDGRVDFSRTALEQDRRRRGFTPWPGAWTTHAGKVLKIHAALPLAVGGREPGEVIAAGPAGIDVSCGGGTVWRLLEVQPEGKRPMPTSAYLAGHPLRPGDRLGG